jgi:hypothetical protein
VGVDGDEAAAAARAREPALVLDAERQASEHPAHADHVGGHHRAAAARARPRRLVLPHHRLLRQPAARRRHCPYCHLSFLCFTSLSRQILEPEGGKTGPGRWMTRVCKAHVKICYCSCECVSIYLSLYIERSRESLLHYTGGRSSLFSTNLLTFDYYLIKVAQIISVASCVGQW